MRPTKVVADAVEVSQITTGKIVENGYENDAKALVRSRGRGLSSLLGHFKFLGEQPADSFWAGWKIVLSPPVIVQGV